MMTAATWKGRFHVAGSLCFQEAITVALIPRLATVPRTVVRRSAFSHRLRPNTSGMTVALVSVKMADACLAMRMNSTSIQ